MTRRARLCLKAFLPLLFLAGLLGVAGAQDPPAKAGSAPERTWSVPLGPDRDPPGPFAKVRLPRAAFKGKQPHGAALSLPSGKAIVLYLDAMLGTARKTDVMLCDVTQGKVLVQGTMNGVYYPFDMNAEGTRVVVRRDSMGTGDKDTAEIWTFAEDGTPSTRKWVPHSGARADRDIFWAAFVGAERVATLSTGGELAVWDVATLKRLFMVEAERALPAVSPNGNYVAFLRENRVGLLDVATGATVGFIPLGTSVSSAALAFRLDGEMALCAAKDKIIFIDPRAGKTKVVPIAGVSGQGLHPSTGVGWVDDRLLIVGENLVDPDMPVPVWHYLGSSWTRPAGGHVWFLAKKGFEDVGLVPLRLPHAAAVRKIVDTRADSSGFFLKPGDAVQIDVRNVPGQDRDAARGALETVLKQNYFKPAASAPLVLQVTEGKERFEERTYTILWLAFPGTATPNDRGGKETYKFRIVTVDVRLLRDGKEIWNKPFQVTPSPPISVSVKGNEAVADKLASYSVADYGLLKKLEIPKFLQEQLGRGVTRMALGHSTVGPDGIDDTLSNPDRLDRLEKLKKTLQQKKK